MPDQEMEEFSEQNLSEGYCFKIKHVPGGYAVGDPEPIEEDDYPQEGDLIKDMPTMLKNVMAVIQETPLGESEESGFNEEPQAPV